VSLLRSLPAVQRGERKEVFIKIYGLLDPRTEQLRYIGKTKNSLSKRLSQHIHDSKKRTTHRGSWIKSLAVLDLLPLVVEFDAVIGDGCAEEIAAIGIARSLGCRLTNATAGGEGATGHSEEALEKMRAAHRNRPPASPETRARISAAQRARFQNPEQRKAMSAATKAGMAAPEVQARLGSGNRGKHLGPRPQSVKDKISASKKGFKYGPLSDQTKAKISAANKGRVKTAEHRAKLSAAHMGKPKPRVVR
jgi:hypothetical protein